MLLSNLVLLSSCFSSSAWIFCSLDGPEKSSWQFRAALAAFICGETSQGVESRRDLKQQHQKLKNVTLVNVTAWKALLCPVLPFIFLSVNIWLLKLFLVWKPWPNLLLLRPPSPYLVFWVPDAAEPLWAVVLPAPDPCWFVASKWQQIFPWPLFLLCLKCHLDGTFN